jgi:transposase
MKRAPTLNVDSFQRLQLSSWANSRLVQVRLAERARIILLAADGLSDKAVAAREDCDRRTVALWRRRFIESGLSGIEQDAPRAAVKRRIPTEKIETVIYKTQSEAPPNGTRWSSRAMARVVGMSEASIRRIWLAHGIAPLATVGMRQSSAPKRAQRWQNRQPLAGMASTGVSADARRPLP